VASAIPYRPTSGAFRRTVDGRSVSLWSLAEFRRRAVVELAAALDPDPDHGAQVARLAMAMFEGTQRIHGLGTLDRELLESAALLHDVGASVSRSKHHRHTQYLILHAALPGFDREEAKWIATIARFHTGRTPKLSHDELAGFEPRDRRRILQLVAMLRVADALDHSHRGRVVGLRVIDGTDGVTLDVAARDEDPGLELWAAERKAELWRRCFGSTLRFRTRRFSVASGRRSSEGEERALREVRRAAHGAHLRRVVARR
jgi:exopolyphosphatase / guanosine-5'-triphosphate,3'-diphosphate pyrophosphatase